MKPHKHGKGYNLYNVMANVLDSGLLVREFEP